MKNKILKYALAMVWLIYTIPAIAGPVDPPGGDDPPFEDPTPIDSWMVALILAGIVLGIYYIRFRKKIQVG